jgi:Leucine-rich repeat (LRR) protein
MSLLIGLIFVRDLTANGSVCKNNPKENIQNQTDFNIEHCANTEIDLGAESARASLTHVKAWDNQISKISDDTFKSANKLFNIDLRDNKIEKISVGAFIDQAELEHLILKLNKLTRIEVGTFDSLTELKELWLQNNELTLIEKGLFDQNTKLEQLYLNYNKIIAIETKVFTKLNSIKSLTLKGNVCVNQDFTSNNFDRDSDCFKRYEILFKPYLDEVYQCRSEKSVCLKENEENLNEMSTIRRNLSDFQLEFKTIHEEKDQVSDKLHNCESQNNSNDNSHYKNAFVIVVCLLVILLIAFLMSIVKICKLSKDNKFLNAKLDKLCEDHVYEKVDYNLTESPSLQ